MRLARALSVKLWLPLLPAAVGAVVLGLLLVATQRIVGQALERRAFVDVDQAAHLYADQLSRVLGRAAAELDLLGGRPGHDHDLSVWRSALQGLKDRAPIYVWIGIIDQQGVVQAGTDGLLEGVSIASRPVFQQGLRGLWFGTLHAPVSLATPMRERGLEVPSEMADIALPLVDAERRLTGVLAAHLDARFFDALRLDVMGPSGDSRDRTLVVLDAQGRVLLGEPPPLDAAGWNHMLSGPVRSARSVAARDGSLVLLSRSAVTPQDSALQVGWQVLAWQPMGAALRPKDELEQAIWRWGGLAVLVLGVIGFWVSRRLAQPYTAMLDAVAARMGTDDREQPGTYLRLIAEQMRRGQLRGHSPGEMAVAQLLQDAGLLQALLDNLPAPVYLVDRAGTVLYWNSACTQVFGHAAQEVLGRPVATVLPDEALQREWAAIQQALPENAGPWTFEVHLRRPDLGDIWGQWRVTQVQGIDGRTVGLLAQVQDLTAERKALQQLHEQGEVLGAIIHSASDAVISVDIEGRISLFNPAASRIFGHAADEMLGRPLDALLPADHRDGHLGTMRRFADSRVTMRPMGVGRVQGLQANGSVLELEASISQVTVRGRKLLTAILRDVTERVKAEQALVRYQHELSELTQRLLHQEQATTRELAQTLHDRLGQTLGAIRLSFDSLHHLAHDQLSERAALRAEALGRQIDQAISEVRQALVALRPPLLEEVGLQAALDNELQQRAAAADPVLLALEVDPAVQSQRWPADVEYAAFMIAREAVDNALRHAQASVIEVFLRGDAGALHLRVHDDGRGLSQAPSRTAPGHLGMVGMRERALAISARLRIHSSAEGGTDIEMHWHARPEAEQRTVGVISVDPREQA